MNILGVCGGNGVILHPFKKHLVGNIEPRAIFHSTKDEQWKANFGNIPLIKKVELPVQWAGFENIDAVIGAPDCGHSSILAYSRAKKLSDPKDNKSLNLYISCVNYFRPKFFLMENLPKILEQYTSKDFENTFKDYELIFHEDSVYEYGNSQKNRIRLVLLGIRKDIWTKEVQYHFSNIYAVSKIKTCGELTENLEVEGCISGHYRENINNIITIYAGKKLSLLDIQNIWLSQPGQKRFNVQGKKFTTAPGVYRNLDSDLPATARKANRQYNQKGLQLSARELARIQGVPDRFELYVEMDKLQYWINKNRATVTKTPPYEIGYWFYKQLRKVLKP